MREDAFRRLCEKLEAPQVEGWFVPAEQMIHHAIAEWDSTVVVRYGKQEDTAVGCNPQKPGRPSHHPLACVIAGTRLCPHMEWRKRNTGSASGWTEAMEKVWRNPITQHRIRLNRGDIGLGQEPIMPGTNKKTAASAQGSKKHIRWIWLTGKLPDSRRKRRLRATYQNRSCP